MDLDFRAFAFIITLAAVVNGLGIVRLLTSFAEYLRRQGQLKINHYWVFNLWAVFQFLLHILLWWSLWNTRVAEAFNFLNYLYLLSGPILLYLGTSLLVPGIDDPAIDLRQHFYGIRVPFFTVAAVFWLWTIFLFPVLTGEFAPTVPALLVFLAIAATLTFTANPKTHATLAIATWLMIISFVAIFAMRLGTIAEAVKPGA